MTELHEQNLESAGKGFTVGGMLRQTFQVVFANIVPFGVIALALTILEGLLYWFLLDMPAFGIDGLGGRSQAEMMEDFGAGVGLTIAGNTILSTIIYALLTALLIYGTVMYLRGQPAPLSAYISNGAQVIFPVFIVSLIVSLSMTLGMILLIVPGVIIYLMWWVAVPAVVVERAGIGDSLKRSAALTKGNRWRILGVFLVLVIIGIALTYPLQFFGLAIKDIVGLIPLLVLSLVVVTFSKVIYAVAVGVGYYQLRVAKEGADINQIAAVFD